MMCKNLNIKVFKENEKKNTHKQMNTLTRALTFHIYTIINHISKKN
jgi:hypothetical protein